MDEQELVEVLRALDGELTSASDVVLVGGAAMILHFGARRATRDVDVLPLQGDIAELRRAVKTIARQHALPEDRMSDAVKGLSTFFRRAFRVASSDWTYRSSISACTCSGVPNKWR